MRTRKCDQSWVEYDEVQEGDRSQLMQGLVWQATVLVLNWKYERSHLALMLKIIL